MRRVIGILLGAAIVLALIWKLGTLPGTVTAQIGGVVVQTRIATLVLATLALFVLLYAALRGLAWLVYTPRRVQLRLARNRRRQGDLALTQTLVSLAANEGSAATRHAFRARKLLGDTPQTLLVAAEAARLAGQPATAEIALQALAARPDAAFLGLRGLLRAAIETQDWAGAALLARRAEAAHPGTPWLREQRWHLALLTQNWTEALALAPPDGPRAALGIAAAGSTPQNALALTRDAFKAAPGLPAAALAYAAQLRAAGRERRAQVVLRQAWQANPQPDLAEAALAPLGTDHLARLQAAQKLVQDNPDHPESLILLARAALQAGVPGQARQQAEAARQAVSQRRVWLLLADIAEADMAQGGSADMEAGRLAQRTALRNAVTAGPDPGWRCEHCGTPQLGWIPVCPHCHRAGSLAWTTPKLAETIVSLPDGGR